MVKRKNEDPPQYLNPIADPDFPVIKGSDFTRTLQPHPRPVAASKPPPAPQSITAVGHDRFGQKFPVGVTLTRSALPGE